ncbi:flagellar hook-length control protein FliK [Salipiger sp. CCB-MM3]|uniref:flagellar hook-length control protein FliK n=1 Tax=Salipiger sp. CCB-MM3 TaxID=1792508 RepID=UPI00187D7A84|nr:flagellar hook-length control protein FliK [Salipiger sp. CCB-MM3]
MKSSPDLRSVQVAKRPLELSLSLSRTEVGLLHTSSGLRQFNGLDDIFSGLVHNYGVEVVDERKEESINAAAEGRPKNWLKYFGHEPTLIYDRGYLIKTASRNLVVGCGINVEMHSDKLFHNRDVLEDFESQGLEFRGSGVKKGLNFFGLSDFEGQQDLDFDYWSYPQILPIEVTYFIFDNHIILGAYEAEEWIYFVTEGGEFSNGGESDCAAEAPLNIKYIIGEGLVQAGEDSKIARLHSAKPSEGYSKYHNFSFKLSRKYNPKHESNTDNSGNLFICQAKEVYDCSDKAILQGPDVLDKTGRILKPGKSLASGEVFGLEVKRIVPFIPKTRPVIFNLDMSSQMTPFVQEAIELRSILLNEADKEYEQEMKFPHSIAHEESAGKENARAQSIDQISRADLNSSDTERSIEGRKLKSSLRGDRIAPVPASHSEKSVTFSSPIESLSLFPELDSGYAKQIQEGIHSVAWQKLPRDAIRKDNFYGLMFATPRIECEEDGLESTNVSHKHVIGRRQGGSADVMSAKDILAARNTSDLISALKGDSLKHIEASDYPKSDASNAIFSRIVLVRQDPASLEGGLLGPVERPAEQLDTLQSQRSAPEAAEKKRRLSADVVGKIRTGQEALFEELVSMDAKSNGVRFAEVSIPPDRPSRTEPVLWRAGRDGVLEDATDIPAGTKGQKKSDVCESAVTFTPPAPQLKTERWQRPELGPRPSQEVRAGLKALVRRRQIENVRMDKAIPGEPQSARAETAPFKANFVPRRPQPAAASASNRVPFEVGGQRIAETSAPARQPRGVAANSFDERPSPELGQPLGAEEMADPSVVLSTASAQTETRSIAAAKEGHPAPKTQPQIRQLAEAIIGAEEGSVELQLEPEELGRVSFNVKHSDQGVTLHITADRPETLELLRRHAEQLARYLQEHGYQNSSFSFAGGRSGRQSAPQKLRDAGPRLASVETNPSVTLAAESKRHASDGLDLRL